MKSTLPLSLALTLAVCACKPADAPAPTAPAATPAQDSAAVDTAAANTTPSEPTASAVASGVASAASGPGTANDPLQQASLSGYGDMKLGSSSSEAKQAWGGELKALGAESEPCHYLVPKWAKDGKQLAFMIEEGKFVRYETSVDKETAPGGGKVGMGEAQLKQLYPNLQSTPHKYDPNGRYLSTTTDGSSPTKLVFEVDGQGKVTEWRVGLLPQADYVEGCS
ncbi:hypothetical protein [Pseudoxanthomonas indica]|uniref:Lectin n=1 Tax=Pseudoxanthomonas indica TaxID=428993 RepID=A0A1T5JYY5_9GAMM|nr:hypothetical protein [Pseudoxanthomonas indica]GGD45349.1 hypothetical protein GCM10007235_16580 [Pseudoxanthomonas indica]SKC56458.1 hypothetical protein SAMN06296058_1198 [Pseudoxanthomonas indica]